jgi:hypothetical protein
MSNVKDRRRWEVLIDGKHQGGSFATELAAKNAGTNARKSADQEIVVRRKGPSPEHLAAAPAAAPTLSTGRK